MNTIIHTIPYDNPLNVFALFEAKPWSLLLHSGQQTSDISRYSYIVAAPFDYLLTKNGVTETRQGTTFGSPFPLLESMLGHLPKTSLNRNLPPFQGGAAGCFSYDCVQYLEKVILPYHDELDFPDLAVGWYDRVISFDHKEQKAWLISTGWPETAPNQQLSRARERANEWLTLIEQKIFLPTLTPQCLIKQNIESNFDADTYQTAIKQSINHILDGEIFETNISQRFKSELADKISAFDCFRLLNNNAKAPFSAFFNGGNFQIASVSPERFLQVRDHQVYAHPIKGTIRRSQDKKEDQFLAQSLMNSEKDQAENVMIVDLMRNDLSKVCDYASVHVPKLCHLESYSNVHHLVSVIQGELLPDCSLIDLLKATFPGGSITGAPKIRAMEIISELEQTRRGPFYGSLGYLTPNGHMDLNILIRTCLIQDQSITYQVGGAITLDSDPSNEYLETLVKGRGIQSVLTGQAHHDCVN